MKLSTWEFESLDDETNRLRLEFDESTLAQAVLASLPTNRSLQATQARWSGHGICVSLNEDAALPDVGQSDQTEFAIGDVVVNVGNPLEVFIAYGPVHYRTVGEGETTNCHKIGTVLPEDHGTLENLGSLVHLSGANTVKFDSD